MSTDEFMEACFPYMPIDAKTETRLLRLHSGGFEDPLSCDLEPCSLAEPPLYEALSYAWDKEDAAQPMLLNGFNRTIKSNLDSALRHLRQQDAALTIWVDAVYINQADVREVSDQVAKMGTIFATAEKVRVWLGPGSKSSDKAMKEVNIIASWEGLSARKLDNTVYFQDILNRRWFQRWWVIQEVILSKCAIVHCGHMSLPWGALMTAISRVHHSRNWDNSHCIIEGEGVAMVFVSLEKLSKASTQAGRLSDILSLLVNHPELRASDPRDFVFLFWGLASDTNEIWAPDYSKPLPKVLVNIVRHSIKTYKSLDIICHSWAPWRPGLPSWIPRFFPGWDGGMRGGMGPRFAKVFAGIAGRNTYNASASLPVDADISLDVSGPVVIYILMSKALRIASISQLELQSIPHYTRRAKYRNDWKLGSNLKTRVPENDYFSLLMGGRTPQNEIPSEHYLIGDVVTAVQDLISNKFKNDDEILRILDCTTRRHLALTSNGLLALVPMETKTEDLVYILPGCSVPVILRQAGEYFKVIGEAYVQGIMEEEPCEDQETFEAHFEIISLI